MCPNIKITVSNYLRFRRSGNRLAKVLLNMRRRYFGRVVDVRSDTTRMVGVIIHEDECPANKMPVLLENGVVEWFSVVTMTLHRLDRLPAWTQAESLRTALRSYRPA